MPRAGLDPAVVVAAAAALADEVGLPDVTMSLLAARLGVRAPSLYKHVDGQADLHRRIATLALTELGDTLRDALQGRSGRDALAAAAGALRRYAAEHPGRYAATVRVDADETDTALLAAGDRVLESLAATVAAYPVAPGDAVHVLRMVRSLFHGFAVIEAAGGFQLATDRDASVEWFVDFLDRGLSAACWVRA